MNEDLIKSLDSNVATVVASLNTHTDEELDELFQAESASKKRKGVLDGITDLKAARNAPPVEPVEAEPATVEEARELFAANKSVAQVFTVNGWMNRDGSFAS